MRMRRGGWQEFGLKPANRRRYQAQWLLFKRHRDPQFNAIATERVRIYRKTTGREVIAKSAKEWRRKHRAKWLAGRRRYYRLKRSCFFCGTYKRYRPMEIVERLVPVLDKFKMRKVLWCGC